jgi:hypothetical protein
VLLGSLASVFISGKYSENYGSFEPDIFAIYYEGSDVIQESGSDFWEHLRISTELYVLNK